MTITISCSPQHSIRWPCWLPPQTLSNHNPASPDSGGKLCHASCHLSNTNQEVTTKLKLNLQLKPLQTLPVSKPYSWPVAADRPTGSETELHLDRRVNIQTFPPEWLPPWEEGGRGEETKETKRSQEEHKPGQHLRQSRECKVVFV